LSRHLGARNRTASQSLNISKFRIIWVPPMQFMQVCKMRVYNASVNCCFGYRQICVNGTVTVTYYMKNKFLVLNRLDICLATNFSGVCIYVVLFFVLILIMNDLVHGRMKLPRDPWHFEIWGPPFSLMNKKNLMRKSGA
jgi:hypothetical protein